MPKKLSGGFWAPDKADQSAAKRIPNKRDANANVIVGDLSGVISGLIKQMNRRGFFGHFRARRGTSS
jgi:hypothetical protein